MEIKCENRERGQTLVIIAILLVVFLGMMALVLDGGMTYANRRSSQNAADAAALAGARELCRGSSASVADAAAQDYALNKNHASHAFPVPDMANLKMNVTTDIVYNTFLANILGRPVMTVTTTASAGCFRPCRGEGVLPVSWACTPIVQGDPAELNACGVVSVPSNSPNPPLYIVMDNGKALGNVSQTGNYCRDPQVCKTQGYTSNACLTSGAVYCDFNHDGVNENISPGDTGWLNLDGGSGNAATLRSWITPPFYQGSLEIHTWMQGITGNISNLYATITQNLLGKIVLIPVFDQVCPGDPQTTAGCNWHTGLSGLPNGRTTDQAVYGTGAGNGYLHIITFSAFRITCVYEGKNKQNPISPWTQCDAALQFLTLNPSINDNSYNSVEGYFINDYQPSFTGNCGVCDGVSPCTIYLNK